MATFELKWLNSPTVCRAIINISLNTCVIFMYPSMLCVCVIIFILRSHFSEEVMGVEQGKKENRLEYGFYLTMKEFLDVRLD